MHYLTFEQIKPVFDTDDFVEGFLSRNAISVFFGAAKSGKTCFVTNLALHVAMGLPWYGRAVERGCVIYISLEGQKTLKNRIAAFREHHGLSDEKAHPFFLVTEPINFLKKDMADTNKICNLAKNVSEKYKLPVSLIVVDTWSRANPGGKEDTADTSAAFAQIDHMRENTGANICIIHHTANSGDEPRGSGVMQANPDILIRVKKSKSSGMGSATIFMQRDGEGSETFNFKFCPVVIGQNKEGKKIESCVAVAVNEHNDSKHIALTGVARVLHNILLEASELLWAEAGQHPVQGMFLKDLKEILRTKEIYKTDNIESRNKAITRAIKTVVEQGVAQVFNNEKIWLIGHRGHCRTDNLPY